MYVVNGQKKIHKTVITTRGKSSTDIFEALLHYTAKYDFTDRLKIFK